MIAEIYERKNATTSGYQPSKAVADFTGYVKLAYQEGYNIIHKEWEELNYYSVISRMNKDQRTFNSFVDESVDDPREAWKWRGTRSMARNRAMAMHAHLTSQYIVPNIFAQNEQDDSDGEMAEVMHDVVEWMTINSNYRPCFLLASMGMLVNPVTFMGAEYYEIMQKIKTRNENGEMVTKEILDEELSGFQAHVYSADQVLITNAYEQNMQRQRSIIERNFIDYEEAKAKYGWHDNFNYVTPGIKSIYSEDDGLFYDVKDEDNTTLVEEVIFKNRREDVEVPFLNGVYMGITEDPEMNPVRHRDNRNAPKYNKVPFGYERINEHFFYYKSLINKVGWDHQLLDAMYENTMNREILEILPPVAISGDDEIDSEVIFPSSVVSFENPETKVQAILPPTRGTSYQAMQAIEASLSEGSISDTSTGQLPAASQKAFSVAQAAQNSKILLGGVGKTLGESVAQIGQLMIDIALTHLTVAQIDELTGNLNYRNFLLEDQNVDGKQVSKKIMFDEALIGRAMSKEDKAKASIKLLEKTGYPETKKHLYRVNPHLFSKRKYMIYVEPDTMLPKNDEFEKAMAMELYTLLRQDPLISPEELVRNLLKKQIKGNIERFMAEEPSPEQIMGKAQNSEIAQDVVAAKAGGAVKPPTVASVT